MDNSRKDRNLEFAAYHIHAISYPIEKAEIVRQQFLKERKKAKKDDDFEALDKVLQKYNDLMVDIIKNIQEHQKKSLGHLPTEDVEKARLRREQENASNIRNYLRDDRSHIEDLGFKKAKDL